MTSALEGLRVLDLNRYGPGLYSTAMMGDMGADVIHVEDPGHVRAILNNTPADESDGDTFGDYMKERWHPAYALNRNKRSIMVDLKTDDGLQVVHDLAAKSDVVVEGFRPGVVDRLDVGYDTLSRINSRIVYCSISGYGQDGPYEQRPGHDPNYIGVAGLLGITGRRGETPTLPGGQIADFAGGSMHAFAGVLLGLLARERTGEGQYIDTSMTDGVVSMLINQLTHWFIAGGSAPEPGTMMLNGAWPVVEVYETADGQYVVLGGTEKYFWENLCTALDREDLIEEYDTMGPEADWVYEELQSVFQTRTREEWMEFFSDKNVCISEVNDFQDVVEDPQLRHRNMMQTVETDQGEQYNQVGIPFKLSSTPGSIDRLAPSPGEHGEEILRDVLEYNTDAVQRVIESEGVVTDWRE